MSRRHIEAAQLSGQSMIFRAINLCRFETLKGTGSFSNKDLNRREVTQSLRIENYAPENGENITGSSLRKLRAAQVYDRDEQIE